jgi:hypothetical protein
MMTDYRDDNVASIRALSRGKAEAEAVKESAAVRSAIARINKAIETRNRQIEPVLIATTGQDSHNPIDWWQWWQSYNDVYIPPGDGSGFTVLASSVQWGDAYSQNYSWMKSGRGWGGVGFGCLTGPMTMSAGRTATFTPHPVPGSTEKPYDEYKRPPYDDNGGKPPYQHGQKTKVWTLAGFQAIETIKPGDRVLAQDPDSGELAYKPVLAVTARPPGDRLVIGLGAEKITTTLGHPFWAVGDGWRMAKELKVGSRLQGLGRIVAVESLEAAEAAPPWNEGAYNLIVADFNTYFVGDHLLLVHDNTPPRPPAVAVPALLRHAPAAAGGEGRGGLISAK